MQYFLLVYDRLRGKILDLRAYAVEEAADAVAERNSLLRKGLDPDVEVVLLGADSIDELKKTHGRYFTKNPEETATRETRELEKISSG